MWNMKWCSPKFFLHNKCSAPLLKVLEIYFWQSLLFCKVASPLADSCFNVDTKYVMSYRGSTVIKPTSCVHVVNSDL